MAADLLDPIPLSALQYGCYCWCQCTLIRIEQVFAENLYTLPGQALHKGADSQVGILEIASPPGNGGRGFKPHACWALARRIMHSGYMQRVAAFLIVSKTLQQSWPIIHPDNDFKVSN